MSKILLIIILSLAVFLAAVLAFEIYFSERIYPGIKIGEYNLGGKTKEEALMILDQKTSEIMEKGLIFSYNETHYTLSPNIIGEDPDLSRSLFVLETPETIERVFTLGRDETFLNNLKNRAKFLIFGKKIKFKYRANQEEIEEILKNYFRHFEEQAQDAKLKIVVLDGVVSVGITSEKNGQVFDYRAAIRQAFENISELKIEPAPLHLIPERPKITAINSAAALNRAKKLVGLCSLTLKDRAKEWLISQKQIRDWLEFQLIASGEVVVALNKNRAQKYLAAIAPTIDVPPRFVKLKIKIDGDVREFEVRQGGRELDFETSYNRINEYILNLAEAEISPVCPESDTATKHRIELVVRTIEPEFPLAKIKEMGIKELLGTGKTSFRGSSKDRIHNIKNGANRLDGILIVPGEEFSLIKALGEVSKRTGYREAKVIKSGQFVYEYGGGLCQIATTLFRAALNAGLKITERQNHTYRVSYYEPAGVDATIYGPAIDFKFLNDTPNHLLIQTKIENDELIFEIWGTFDGREVEITKPKILSVRSPGPTRYILSEEIAPGIIKCIEKAISGATTAFTRIIKLNEEVIRSETWKSYYLPWDEICLVGKPKTEN